MQKERVVRVVRVARKAVRAVIERPGVMDSMKAKAVEVSSNTRPTVSSHRPRIKQLSFLGPLAAPKSQLFPLLPLPHQNGSAVCTTMADAPSLT